MRCASRPVLTKFLLTQTKRKGPVGALDDASALAARTSIELADASATASSSARVSTERSMAARATERNSIQQCGSIVLGSVANYMDRYGYDVLPLALKMLRGETVPPRTRTQHTLITAKNIFVVYPPYDIN